ncbi:hypothetical protein [Sulfoacidibacillus thermotolerans]|uniref:Uncharacterized protein n=1 Tax=Sulfoacidibacillus thermotolerans TaxID=1765684 RepID=A0A2U3DC32_SULT2|nr:hypothetical protein [Sulfoacidibacillus thermotolerans]PWI58843.1 hypothetical protein BM613_01775 [Sulfoacidibacillus thermotolerans]
MGERVTEKTSTTQKYSGLTPPPEGWRFKIILYTAAVVGVIGAAIGYLQKGSDVNSITMGIGLPMVMAPYFVVPRTKTARIWQGSVTGAVAGLVAMLLLLIFATSRFANQWTVFGTAFLQFLIMAIGISWMSVALSDWAEKRRQKLEAKRADEVSGKTLESFPKRPRLRAPKKEEIAHPARVHRYNRKKKR